MASSASSNTSLNVLNSTACSIDDIVVSKDVDAVSQILESEIDPTAPPRIIDEEKRKNAAKTRTKRNFTDDGQIDTTKRRTGRDKSDTYYTRTNQLIQKAEQLYNLTGARVTLTIHPLTDRGHMKHYTSPNYWTEDNVANRDITVQTDNQTVPYNTSSEEENTTNNNSSMDSVNTTGILRKGERLLMMVKRKIEEKK